MLALGDTYQVVFNYRVMATSAEYFQVDLNADTGPLGTKDYRIALEAVSIDAKHTFIHLTYAYGYGITGRIAMKTYLSTIGLGKVGFTTIDDQSSIKTDAPIEYIGGVRGLIERNTIRYYLAIDAFLSALSTVPDKRLEQRLTRWFNGTDQYPRQLHEMERPEYMAMKYKEYQRQQMAQ